MLTTFLRSLHESTSSAGALLRSGEVPPDGPLLRRCPAPSLRNRYGRSRIARLDTRYADRRKRNHGPASDFWTGPCQPSALLDSRVRSDVWNGRIAMTRSEPESWRRFDHFGLASPAPTGCASLARLRRATSPASRGDPPRPARRAARRRPPRTAELTRLAVRVAAQGRIIQCP